MKIADALQGVTKLFLDTAPIIYYVESHPRYFPAMQSVFAALDNGGLLAVTSPVTLAECLILPYRSGTVTLQQIFAELLLQGPSTHFTVIDGGIARQAAELRATHNLGLLDALQAASALAEGCDAILTNDSVFQRVPGLKVLPLDDLLD